MSSTRPRQGLIAVGTASPPGQIGDRVTFELVAGLPCNARRRRGWSGGSMGRIWRAFGAGLVAAAAGLTPTWSASAQVPLETLEGVQIVGDPVVGSPVAAVPMGTIDPSSVDYRWCRQGDRPGRCAPGAPVGSGPVYVPTAADVGYSLLVKATATIDTFTIEVISPPTVPVAAALPPPTDPTDAPTD